MYDYEFHLQVFCQFLTFLAAGNHSGIWSTVRALQKFVKRVVFDKFGAWFLIPGWKRAFTNHIEPDFGSNHGPSGGRNHLIWPRNLDFLDLFT